MTDRSEQAFAIEKPAAHDQRRRLFKKRGYGSERLRDGGVGCIRS